MSEKILLGHGSGGRMMNRLIGEMISSYLNNPILAPLGDAAELPMGNQRFAFSTDSFTVFPPDFPGGNIGKLAVCGTVNDVAAQGGNPEYISLALIIEEGLLKSDLHRYLASIQKTCEEANVVVVTGDTKVVPRGKVDRIFIITTGIGRIAPSIKYGTKYIQAGDKIIITGPIGDHEAAIISARGEFDLEIPVISDCAPLANPARELRENVSGIRLLRDPTRGGLASVLDELAIGSDLGFHLNERTIPIRDAVQGLADFLGYDPLYMACEGRYVIVASKESALKAVDVLKGLEETKEACIIGEVSGDRSGVFLHTEAGGIRPLIRMEGSQLPRIC